MGLSENLPAIGDIVLFCIDEELQRWRPLLVVDLEASGKISGELFLHHEKDRALQWPRKLFYILDKNSRTQWVSGVSRGLTLGCWRLTTDPWKAVEKAPIKDYGPPPNKLNPDPEPRPLPPPPRPLPKTKQHLPLSRVQRGVKN